MYYLLFRVLLCWCVSFPILFEIHCCLFQKHWKSSKAAKFFYLAFFQGFKSRSVNDSGFIWELNFFFRFPFAVFFVIVREPFFSLWVIVSIFFCIIFLLLSWIFSSSSFQCLIVCAFVMFCLIKIFVMNSNSKSRKKTEIENWNVVGLFRLDKTKNIACDYYCCCCCCCCQYWIIDYHTAPAYQQNWYHLNF